MANEAAENAARAAFIRIQRHVILACFLQRSFYTSEIIIAYAQSFFFFFKKKNTFS